MRSSRLTLDTLGREVRSSYEWLPGRQRKITFTTLTPIHEDGTPNVQTVAYEFDSQAAETYARS